MASFQLQGHIESLRIGSREQSGLQLPLRAALEAGALSPLVTESPPPGVGPRQVALPPLASPCSLLAPTLVLVSIWAPRSSRSRTMITFPLREAMCNGVMPFWKEGQTVRMRILLGGRGSCPAPRTPVPPPQDRQPA